MTFASIIQLIVAILNAPEEIRALVLLFSKSSEEKKIEIRSQVKAMMDKSSSGRPVWESYERP